MTRLNASLKDFTIDKPGGTYNFRFGNCEEFATTMQEFKESIPLEERTPIPEKQWIWKIKITPRNRAALSQLFDNFTECLQIAESQLKLWGD